MRSARYRFGGWPDEYATLHVLTEPRDLDALRGWLAERVDEPVGLDIETNALDPWQHGHRARMVQIADPAESWCVPVWSPTGALADGDAVARIIHEHPRWVCHYTEADTRFAGRGLPWDPVRWDDPDPHFCDTQVVLGMYDPRTVTTQNPKDRIDRRIPRKKGLKETTTRLLSPALAAAEVALHERFRELAPVGHRVGQRMKTWGFGNIPWDDPVYLLYGALDPLATIRLWHLMRRELRARGQWARTEAALAEQWVVDGATYRGMPVDAPYARWLDGQLAEVIEDRAALLARHGIGASGQGPAVGAAFNALGVTSPKVSADGAQSWDAEALEMLTDRCHAFLNAPGDLADPERVRQQAVVAQVQQLVATVRDARGAGKYRGTWVRPMLWTVDHADGAMHPSMRNIGTVTTRMSAQKSATAGPLHSAPKRDNRLRAAVRAERGCLVVSADFRQGEPYVMAALSGDRDYLAHLESGDINARLATRVYGDAFVPADGQDPTTPSYMMRQRCKFAWLAACYGARERKVDALLGVHTGVLAEWHADYPTFWAFAEAMNQQTVITLDSGHRVPLWDRYWVDDDGELRLRTDAHGDPVPSRLGLNAVTQATQSDLLRVAMHRLRVWGWHWALRFFVHDELIGIVPAPLAEPFRVVLERAMTVTYRGVTVRCKAEIEGETWQPQPSAFDPSVLAELSRDGDLIDTTA
jgi:hypothetical protein